MLKPYRKKPVVIHAVRLTRKNAQEIVGIMDDGADGVGVFSGVKEGGQRVSRQGVYIKTLEGIMWARWGDWIIRGVKGEYYPCKHEIFRETYEALAND